MNPAKHRPPKKALHALAAAALAWASPGHCAPVRAAWSWADLWSGPDVDTLLMLLTALFWVVTHAWVLLVVWAEARATRPARSWPESEPEPEFEFESEPERETA